MRPEIPTFLRSFRVRIALLSTLLSGLVLAGFMTWAWVMVQRIDLHSMDEDIRQIGFRALSFPHGPRPWNDILESLESRRGGGDASESIILRVLSRGGTPLYASSGWPEELNNQDFTAMAPETELESPQEEAHGIAPPGIRGEVRRLGPPTDDDRMRPFGLLDPPHGPPHVTMARPYTQAAGGNEWRIGVLRNRDEILAVGLNMSRFNFELRRLRNAFLIAAPGALFLIAASGWLVSQRALRPVRALTAAAERITAKGLDQRIPDKEEDIEFERLITVFNRMLDRLEGSFTQAVRFSADAAHELKTPLTILQGELEQAIQESPPGSSQQQTYGALQEEVQRLKNIIRKLLLLSLADSGQLKPNLERVNLSEMLDAACEDIAILAPDLRVEKDIAPDQWVMADPDLMRQAIQNLINNATKYNEPGGFVRFKLCAERSVLRLVVANSGAGIPASDRGKVFERFYRADKSRNRKQEGVGLGLSLAREIARAHQGDIVLENAPSGQTVFTLLLPSAGA